MSNEHLSNNKIFPLGQKVEANFIGNAYLKMVFTDPTPLNTNGEWCVGEGGEMNK